MDAHFFLPPSQIVTMDGDTMPESSRDKLLFGDWASLMLGRFCEHFFNSGFVLVS
jgi:hypothetical protein